MNLIKYVLVSCISFAALLIAVAIVSPVAGDENTDTEDDECPLESYITVDKFIRDPRATGDVYVDNLSEDEYRFSPGEDIIFKILVKNTGPDELANITVTDALPATTNLLKDDGSLDTDTREISQRYDQIASQEIKTWYVRVRVKPDQDLTDHMYCEDPDAVNRVVASDEDNHEVSDDSSFCVEKEVLGPVALPKTGASIYTSILAGIGALAGVSLVGKRFITA